MSKSYFSWERFWRSVLIKAPMKDCADAIFTSGGLAKWFIGTAQYTNADGQPRADVAHARERDSYHWRWLNKDLELSGQVTLVTPDSIAFTFGDAGTVMMSIRQEGDRVRVTIRQEAWPDRDYDKEAWVNCYVCWSFFLLNLKSVLEHGIDLRETAVNEDELVNR
jgi:hypothetical protein